MADVVGDGSRAVDDGLYHVSFTDPKLAQAVVFTFGRRLAEASSKDRDALILVMTPYLEGGDQKPSPGDWLFERRGAKWHAIPSGDGKTAPFSGCERVLRAAVESVRLAQLLYSTSHDDAFTADVASLNADPLPFWQAVQWQTPENTGSAEIS